MTETPYPRIEAAPAPPKSSRQYDLDLFRFVAALAVVAYHFTFRGVAVGDGAMVTHFDAIGEVSRYGYLGVNFFFMISGYVILMSALNRSVPEFFVSRVARLYPAFWAGLAITTLFTLVLGGYGIFTVNLRQFLANVTMAPNALGQPHIDSAYWSLFVELRFYAIIALLMATRLLRRIDAVLAAWTLVMVVISALGTRISFSMITLLDNLVFPTYAHYFIAGALFFLIKSRGITATRVFLLGANGLLALRWARIEARRLGRILEIDYSMAITIGLVALFFAIFAAVAFNLTGWLQRPVFLQFGALTYTLYVVHQHVGYLLMNELDGRVNRFIALAMVSATVMAMAVILNKLVEEPAGRWLRKRLTALLVRQKPPSDQPGATGHPVARSEDPAAA